jgi:hypothetical protein
VITTEPAQPEEAAGLANRLLAAVASGAPGISDSDVLAARESARHVQATCDLAEAKYRHAHKLTLERQVNLLRAQGDVAQYEYETEGDKLDAAATAVDAAVAAVHAALAGFEKQGQEAKAAQQRALVHNNAVRAAIAENELIEHHRQMGTLPAANVPQYWVVPIPRVELFLEADRSRIDGKRHVVPSLSVLIKRR